MKVFSIGAEVEMSPRVCRKVKIVSIHMGEWARVVNISAMTYQNQGG